MQTIRGQLATWYALAMGATLGVFAVSIYLVERSWIRERIDERLQIEADLIATIISEASASSDSIGEPEAPEPTSDQDQPTPLVSYGVHGDVLAMLEGVPDYVLILSPDPTRVPNFFNGRALQLEIPSRNIFAQTARQTLNTGGNYATANLERGAGDIWLFVRPLTAPDAVAVVTGVPGAELRLHLDRLLSVMMAVATMVVAASTWVAYLLAGRTLKPVDRIVDEVEAISDGRSLHRRLAAPKTKDELTRLITTVNAMLGRLETSFFALRRFTADASHELKTPLTVLRAGIERAVTHPKTEDEVLEVLEETLVEVNRMTELVDSLLMLARTDEGRARLLTERVDLRDILAEVAETAGILEEHSSVSVDVAVPDKPLMLSLDRGRIRQLLMNLLTNAIKFNKPGGQVSISSSREDMEVVIRVSDTGVGMSGSELAHIFERFWRADPARSRTGPRSGAGLGMAISKWIVEVHGGSIEAESSPKRGTTITVRLPTDVNP